MGEALRAKRKELHLSQSELAKRAGINQRTVSIVENGSKGTELSTLFSLLAALGLEILVKSRPKEDEVFNPERFFK